MISRVLNLGCCGTAQGGGEVDGHGVDGEADLGSREHKGAERQITKQTAEGEGGETKKDSPAGGPASPAPPRARAGALNHARSSGWPQTRGRAAFAFQQARRENQIYKASFNVIKGPAGAKQRGRLPAAAQRRDGSARARARDQALPRP